MARPATITCPADTWTQLTESDATNISLAVLGGRGLLGFTTDTTEPAAASGLPVGPGEGFPLTAIADLVSTGAADRAWFYALGSAATVYVDQT